MKFSNYRFAFDFGLSGPTNTVWPSVDQSESRVRFINDTDRGGGGGTALLLDLLVAGSRVTPRKACTDIVKEIRHCLPYVVPESCMWESVPAGCGEDDSLVDASNGKIKNEADEAASKQ